MNPPPFRVLNGNVPIIIVVSVMKNKSNNRFVLHLNISLDNPVKKIGGNPFEDIKNFNCDFINQKI